MVFVRPGCPATPGRPIVPGRAFVGVRALSPAASGARGLSLLPACFLRFGRVVHLRDEWGVLVGLVSPWPPHDLQLRLRLGALALGVFVRSLLLSQLAKLLAQILGLDAVVGCFLALLDGLLAVETAGDDLGHLGEAIAGQGEIFGPLDPPAEVEGLALDRVGRLGDFLIVGLAVRLKAAYSAMADFASEA